MYLSRFYGQLESLLKGSKITENLDRRNDILLFLKGKQQKSVNFNKDTDLNILIGIYNKWYKIFPFELSYFASLKNQYSNIIPLIEKVKYNKYTNLHVATPKTKQVLINYLIEITNNILIEINTETLFKKGLINDINKVELEIICQKMEQKLKKVILITPKMRIQGIGKS